MTYVEVNGIRIDRIVASQLPYIQKEVLHKDKDKQFLIDGRERSGKSKFGRQLAKALDITFNIDRIAFNAEEFVRVIKNPQRKKGDAVLLDEAYAAVNSRAALSDINRAMVQLGTEMGQLNLIVIIILPSYFDLDKYFALWRTETLFHVYFDKDGDRGQYLIFPFDDKLQLYIRGKKTYNYKIWHSPYPPCRFPSDDPIDEVEYNKRKLEAFRKRPITIMEKKWKERTLRLMNFLTKKGLNYEAIAEITRMKVKNVAKSLENWVKEGEKAKDILLNLTNLDEEDEWEEGGGKDEASPEALPRE